MELQCFSFQNQSIGKIWKGKSLCTNLSSSFLFFFYSSLSILFFLLHLLLSLHVIFLENFLEKKNCYRPRRQPLEFSGDTHDGQAGPIIFVSSLNCELCVHLRPSMDSTTENPTPTVENNDSEKARPMKKPNICDGGVKKRMAEIVLVLRRCARVRDCLLCNKDLEVSGRAEAERCRSCDDPHAGEKPRDRDCVLRDNDPESYGRAEAGVDDVDVCT